MRKILICFMGALLFAACGGDDSVTPTPVPTPDTPTYNRTVLVYMSAENNLSLNASNDILEMKTGSASLGNDDALIVYVDNADRNNKPYIMRIKNGEVTDKITMKTDESTADPRILAKILKYTSTAYPAKEYGLVLWGHASGWLIEDSLNIAAARRRSYGYDSGQDSGTGAYSMNIYTLAQTLQSWGKPLKFILADCCQFQCIESAYELRNTTQYIIGSPAEIPKDGAPYDKLTPCLFDKSETFYEKIVDTYFEQTLNNMQLPLSAIRTSTLETFAEATNKVLHTFALPADQGPDLRTQRIIYYKGHYFNINASTMYDMHHYIRYNASEADYETWKKAYNDVVVYKKFTPAWITQNQIDFSWADMTEANYGGISMFVPQERDNEYVLYNSNIRKTSWYHAARLNELGW